MGRPVQLVDGAVVGGLRDLLVEGRLVLPFKDFGDDLLPAAVSLVAERRCRREA